MTYVKIPTFLLDGVLYALDQVQYSGEWYDYQRTHGQPDRAVTEDALSAWPGGSEHLAKLKQIRAAEDLILRKISSETPSGFVYLIGQAAEDEDTIIVSVKIGFSKDPWRRLKQLQTASPRPLYIIGRIADQKVERERELHRLLHAHRANGEWFRWSPIVKTILADAGFKFEYPVVA